MPAVDIGEPAVAIVAGQEHTCVLLSEGRVRCFGRACTDAEDCSAGGRLGYPLLENVGDNEAPAQAGDVPLAGKADAIAAGHDHTCALIAGAVLCWGEGSSGSLGFGGEGNILASTSRRVDVGGVALAIATSDHTCTVLSDATLRCWGKGGRGQLASGTSENTTESAGEVPSQFAPIELGVGARSVVCAYNHTCVITEPGEVMCWGIAGEGELGYGVCKPADIESKECDYGDEPGEVPKQRGTVPVF